MVHTQKIETLILGAGLSGLIASHYFTNSIILEKEKKIGGDFNNKSVPKYLHNHREIINLFKELDIALELKDKKIGIWYKDRMFDFNDKSLGEEVVKEYSLKTKNKIDLKSMNKYLERKENKYISNEQDLIDNLYNSATIILDSKIKLIDLKDNVVVNNETVYRYRNLISTIPIDIFKDLSKEKIKLEKRDKTIIAIDVYQGIIDYDFVYFPEKKYSFNRISSSNTRMSFEFPNEMQSLNAIIEIKDFVIKNELIYNLNYYELKRVEFYFPNEEIKIKDNVILLGRFATGDYSIEVQDVIRKIKS